MALMAFGEKEVKILYPPMNHKQVTASGRTHFSGDLQVYTPVLHGPKHGSFQLFGSGPRSHLPNRLKSTTKSATSRVEIGPKNAKTYGKNAQQSIKQILRLNAGKQRHQQLTKCWI